MEAKLSMHLSQLDFANLCDLQADHISNLESENQNNLTLITMNKIANGLGVSTSQLLANEDPGIVEQDEWTMKIISALKPLSDDERKKMYAIVKDASELCKKKSKYAGNALYIIIRNLVLSAL